MYFIGGSRKIFLARNHIFLWLLGLWAAGDEAGDRGPQPRVEYQDDECHIGEIGDECCEWRLVEQAPDQKYIEGGEEQKGECRLLAVEDAAEG